jgi:DNA-binding NarL/FixJ family response regulator
MFDDGDAIADRLDIEAACKKLTSKQTQVLGLWLLGYTQAEIAAEMGIGQASVRDHLRCVVKKIQRFLCL